MIWTFNDDALFLTALTLFLQIAVVYDVVVMMLRRFGLTRRMGLIDRVWRKILPKSWWRDDFGEFRFWSTK